MIGTLFVLLNDILDKEGSTILERIGVTPEKSYESKPKECPSCEKKSMADIEIIGAHESSLLWQCMACGGRFLKYSEKKTEQLLENATEAWTNPNDWGEVDKTLH